MAALLAPAGEALVLAVVALAHLPVLAVRADWAQVVVHRAHRVPLRLLARWPVLARAPRPVQAARRVVVALAPVPVVARPVVVPAVRPLNRQWCSAAMARTTP